MANSYEYLVDKHPCLAKKKANNGRIHLPISPTCNIECLFCERCFNDYENRPGVASKVIKPTESIDIIKKALEVCPNITVVGIAGPGDTLASDYALETFELIDEHFPKLIKCMSTNGLLLVEKADRIIKAKIDSLTVTVNAIDPLIESKLNQGIFYHGEYIEGIRANEILIKNQLEGIKKISSSGITVKVNTVLVIGINDQHIGDVAKTVKEMGAKIYNIIPLIPQNKLKNYKAPTCLEIDKARNEAEKYIDVFKHCARCRADSIGVPGEKDYGPKIYDIKTKDTFSHG